MRLFMIETSYLVASMLFILGLRGLSHPESARRGMFLAEVGMLMAIIGTLLHQEIVTYTWIIVGLVLGSAIGTVIALFVNMTAIPQRTAFSHALGALAVALVGIAEYLRHMSDATMLKTTALGFEVFLGSITFTGSLIAFAKLQELMRGTPIVYKGQNILNMALLALLVMSFGYFIYNPSLSWVFYSLVALSSIFGIMLILPIGAADMPVVMALLNSYSGLAAAATGLVLNNNVLLIAGTLDGGSGFILSVLMCKAMNRSIYNVLFGAFGSVSSSQTKGEGDKIAREVNAEDVGTQLAYANQVVFVPGYGMAQAQAQHAIRQLASALEARGVTVKYGIHPVAGRMPGHMNVLLAEADVPYTALYELEQINPELHNTDVAVVIGANDTVNLEARDNAQSPIYGMPIIEVDHAKSVVVLKRGAGKGFAGIDNPLFYKDNTGMLYGDAKTSVNKLIQCVQNA